MKIKIFLLLSAALLLLCGGCARSSQDNNEILDNYPYEPDTPAPAAHEGVFVSEHGKMTFSGDGENVVIDFDEELASLTGLPRGVHEAVYVFLSGNLPPLGSYPVRYDTAHELQITANGNSVVIDMGLAAEDGSTGTTGVDTVTPERIPMLFHNDSGFFDVEFLKEGE